MSPQTGSARPSATDRLRSLYRSPQPYTSLYLACGEYADDDPYATFAQHREQLVEQGASDTALDALDARLRLPVPEEVGGWALFAAADGSTAVDFAPEGPSMPVLAVGALPMAAPLIEWDQWRIPHVAVSFGSATAEVATFLPGSAPSLAPLAVDPTSAASALRTLATNERLRLIAVVDEGGDAGGLVERLRGIVPPGTNVVLIDGDAGGALDDVVDSTVRHVADVVARDTVRSLEDFRFMHANGAAVEGADAVFSALASGRGHALLVHDDPDDIQRASFGDGPRVVSADWGDFAQVARRADVAIWSAVSQGIGVRVIPTTGSTGPEEDIALTLISDEAVL